MLCRKNLLLWSTRLKPVIVITQQKLITWSANAGLSHDLVSVDYEWSSLHFFTLPTNAREFRSPYIKCEIMASPSNSASSSAVRREIDSLLQRNLKSSQLVGCSWPTYIRDWSLLIFSSSTEFFSTAYFWEHLSS